MEEIWKPVTGYSKYEVSNCGNIRRIGSQVNMSLYDKGGYLKTQLINDQGIQKKPSIHRLVAIAFISNPENKPDIHHIDHNKRNNHVSNLMWVTPQENNSYNLYNFARVVSHAPKSVASLDYFEVYGALFRNIQSAAKATGLSSTSIRKLCLSGTHKHFRYIPAKYY